MKTLFNINGQLIVATSLQEALFIAKSQEQVAVAS